MERRRGSTHSPPYLCSARALEHFLERTRAVAFGQAGAAVVDCYTYYRKHVGILEIIYLFAVAKLK